MGGLKAQGILFQSIFGWCRNVVRQVHKGLILHINNKHIKTYTNTYINTTVHMTNINIDIDMYITFIHHECRNMRCAVDEIVLLVDLEGVRVLSF